MYLLRHMGYVLDDDTLGAISPWRKQNSRIAVVAPFPETGHTRSARPLGPPPPPPKYIQHPICNQGPCYHPANHQPWAWGLLCAVHAY